MNLLIWIGAGLVLLLLVLLALYRQQVGKKQKGPSRNHHLSALEALADGDDDRALAELQEAVKVGQGGVDAYLRLAEIYRARGQLKKAIHLHRSLAVSDSHGPVAKRRILRGLAEDYLAAGRWDDALKQLEELHKLDGKDAGIHRRLSQIHLRRKDGERAHQALKRAHKLEGAGKPDELAILHAELARRYMGDQQWREARKAIGAALKQDEHCLPALRLSVDLYLNEGKEQEAADELQRVALTGLAGSEEDYARIEKQFFELGRYHEIQFVYQEVLSRHPEFWPARFALAVIMEKRGHREDAVKLLDPALDADDATAGRCAALLLEWNERDRAARWLSRWDGTVASGVARYRCRSCGIEHSRPRWYCPACSAFKSYEPVQVESRAHSAS